MGRLLATDKTSSCDQEHKKVAWTLLASQSCFCSILTEIDPRTLDFFTKVTSLSNSESCKVPAVHVLAVYDSIN